ncbi:DUF5060 domain-containing protein, partial [Candidatus Saccharibacteria bacterium]|nr:DUF5060 domain-containing protein [Candidatus Saccharibacteria bacterium]
MSYLSNIYSRLTAKLSSKAFKNVRFSRKQLTIYGTVFAAIGGTLLFLALAAPNTKVWDSQADFDTGTKSSVTTTTDGKVTLTPSTSGGTTASIEGSSSGENFTTDSNAVLKYGVYEITLTGNGSVSNPFDTVATVTFIPPSGSANAKTIEAFYDSGNTWRARVYATETGAWTWSSTSTTDSGLNGQSGSFSTASSNLKGMLRKHSTNSKQWMTDNGQTFLGIGDTAYYLFGRANKDGTAISEPTFQKYVQDDVALNINSIFADLNGGGYLDAQW